KRTKMRFAVGSSGIALFGVTKTPKVNVEPAVIGKTNEGAIPLMHWPVTALVWHSRAIAGSTAVPVSADTVIKPAAPTFAVATANTPVRPGPGLETMPVLPIVAARATMSGTGPAEADR